MIIIFERVEILNSELQKVSLNFQEAQLKIKRIISSIRQQRNEGFEDIWEDILKKSNELKLKPPAKLINKKIPKKFMYGSEPHSFSSGKDRFKVSFYEVLDLTISSLNDRFQKNVINQLCSLEKFIIGEDKLITDVITFYGTDFNNEKLLLHRNMLLDIAKSREIPISSTQNAIDFLKSDISLRSMLNELNKLVKMILTVPVSSCTTERSFSALRRLKTFLRSTMSQNRLNDMAILHVHRNENVDIEIVANSFINKKKIRQNTFAL